MPGTRSSTRNASKESSPSRSDDGATGTKRKPETEPSPKRSSKASKKQATIEETLRAKQEDTEMKDASPLIQDEDANEDEKDHVVEDAARKQTSKEGASARVARNENDHGKAEASKTKVQTEDDENDANTHASGAEDGVQNGDVSENSKRDGEGAVHVSSQREKDVPSNILEKGIIYFFTRNRVGIEEAESVGDLQRTFFVLRPLPIGAKLGDGVLDDQKNIRLLALPKKAFPKSHNDRFMAFVEKANTSIKDLKDIFFGANEYETKTQGTRRNEPVTPTAEGVYAITRTEDRTTHLVYSITIPSEIGEVQEDLGIKSQGSFIVSVKNPERSGPASASLPQKPEFTQK